MNSAHVGRVRWLIAVLLFGETILNYLDLQTLSVVAPELTKAIGLTDLQYAHIAMAFQFAYLFSFIVGGWVIDKLGVRWGLFLSMLWWSAAAAAHGFASSAHDFMLFRLLLGIGYPGAYMAAAKAAAEWYPPQERRFVTGIYSAGATVGATVAPPLIAWLTLKYSWRDAFFVTGAAGLVYAVAWLVAYRSPTRHPWLREPERQYILSNREEHSTGTPPLRQMLPFFFQNRYFWAIVLGRMIGDTPWIFYVLWIPKYLSETQGLDLHAIGYLAWIPFLFSDVGSLGGGWFSGIFVRRGLDPVQARLRVMLGCAAITFFTFVLYFVHSIVAVIALLSVMMLCTMGWMINLSTIPVDVFPKEMVGTGVGLTTAGAIIGQLAFTFAIGHIVQSYSYGPLFFIMSGLELIAYTVIRLILRNMPQPVTEQKSVTHSA
jgi:MFS transporter, ACS family, hexuronate transporter